MATHNLRDLRIPPPQPRRLDDRKKGAITAALLVVIIVVFVWAFGPCSNTEDPNVAAQYRARAINAAEVLGFSQVSVTAAHRNAMLNGCDENDRYAFEATATKETRPTPVSLLICCGGDYTGTGAGCSVRIH